MASHATPAPGTIDAKETAKFAALSEQWWNPRGPMAPLHKLNPVRLAYIRDQLCNHFGRDSRDRRCLGGLRLLDLGCGAGLVSEPLARMGASVTGADTAEPSIAVARAHAAEGGLSIDYRVATAEALADGGEAFDAIVSLEVVEHVGDVALYLESAARMLAPGGLFLFSTPNRTAASFLSVIVGAEYLLRWLPRGTHDWRRFLTPEEMTARLEAAGLKLLDLKGLSFSPLRGFRLGGDTSVNYIGAAVRA